MEQRHVFPDGAAGPGELTREAIARALERERCDGLRGDDAPLPQRPLTAAAVLITLVENPDGLGVLLTERTAHLNNHAGQICFPGGRLEDGEDAVAAALRETHEEVGLPPERIELIGRLDPYITVTGFHVTPVVGVTAPPLALAPDPFEVADVFEVPLAFILDPANHRRQRRVVDGRARITYAMPYGDRYIWGATAGMLMNLYERLRS